MRGGPGGVCNEYTRLGTKLTNDHRRCRRRRRYAGRPPLPSPHHTTPQSAGCAARSGDFMACTVITLWVYRTDGGRGPVTGVGQRL